MSIPRETNKELVVVVENDSIAVAISPPILDATIVTGVAPQAHPDTMMISSYDPIGDVLFIRTTDGREFTINNAIEVTP
jgi:hypothetical protein